MPIVIPLSYHYYDLLFIICTTIYIYIYIYIYVISFKDARAGGELHVGASLVCAAHVAGTVRPISVLTLWIPEGLTDSSIILILRGGIPRPIGDFPEILSQAILVGIMLVGRLGVGATKRDPTPRSQMQ